MKVQFKSRCLLFVVCGIVACTSDDDTAKPQDEVVAPAEQQSESALRDLTIVDDSSANTDTIAYTEALTAAEMEQSRGLRDFAFRFMKTVVAHKPEENVFVSPYSANVLLSLLANGSGSETRDEILSVLGVDDNGMDCLNACNKKTAYRLHTADDQVALRQANAVWVQYSLPIYKSYVDVVNQMYDGNVVGIDFSSVSAGRTINDWCSENTNGLIDHILDDGAHSEYAMIMANAIYFNAKWFMPFDESDTNPKVFHNVDGSESTVNMMSQKGSFKYAQTDLYDVVAMQLGYYLKRYFAMHILLPHAGVTLDQCLDSLEPDSWLSLFPAPTSTDADRVDLWLPRFEMNMHTSLRPMLQKMGMYRAFSAGSAQFDSQSPQPLFLSEILQNTSLKVTESAVEAAAATWDGMAAGLPGQTVTYKHFHVDRPFFFTLQDNRDGTILFMGVVNKL